MMRPRSRLRRVHRNRGHDTVTHALVNRKALRGRLQDGPADAMLAASLLQGIAHDRLSVSPALLVRKCSHVVNANHAAALYGCRGAYRLSIRITHISRKAVPYRGMIEHLREPGDRDIEAH